MLKVSILERWSVLPTIAEDRVGARAAANDVLTLRLS